MLRRGHETRRNQKMTRYRRTDGKNICWREVKKKEERFVLETSIHNNSYIQEYLSCLFEG
jgi:uncharacterized protein YkuJ